ncbi:hypothetical protein Trydic_g19316 [Trypoxylus dichotomus]
MHISIPERRPLHRERRERERRVHPSASTGGPVPSANMRRVGVGDACALNIGAGHRTTGNDYALHGNLAPQNVHIVPVKNAQNPTNLYSGAPVYEGSLSPV